MLELLVSLVLGWNLVTVSGPTYPPDIADGCVGVIAWQHGDGWRMWDTSERFGSSDFFADHGPPGSGRWATYWMEPGKAYWVYCE